MCERGVLSICNVDSRVVKVNCFWFVACEKEQERKEGGREGAREGGWEGGREGRICVPEVLDDDIAARVAVVRVFVRVGHAIAPVVGAERAAVVREVDAVVRGAVVDLRGGKGEGRA